MEYFYYAMRTIAYLSGTMVAICAAVSKIDVTKYAAWGVAFRSLILAVQSNNWWLTPAALVIVPVATLASNFVGPPWVWSHIRYILDLIQAEVFPRAEGFEPHHHRVTLFKYKKFIWSPFRGHLPWSGWLKSVARSGHTTLNSVVIFWAPDDADKVQGVAGKTWARNSQVILEELADLASSNDPIVMESYAKDGFVPAEWVTKKKGRCLARSFYGIPVETKNGLWGVIVIDSRSEKIHNHAQLGTIFSVIKPYLGKLLEKA